MGYASGYYTTVSNNVAYGYYSLYTNSTGTYNTAIGYMTLTANTTVASNSGDGFAALYSNTTGSNNSAIASMMLSASSRYCPYRSANVPVWPNLSTPSGLTR